ncbi:MAG: DAK2 domain-containing protein, partial [Lachnospiraceae bacterium]|nr:DAK2 domain-containing protein [Lachnospiraceae bacterium]
PKEGTILTVARGVSEKWNELAAEETDLEKIFEQVLDHGDKVLAYTPELLPVLKEAGVVDSGGQGLMVFLKGAYACMMGREVTAGETAEDAGRKAVPDDKYTYRVSYGVKPKHPVSQEQEAGFKSWLEAIGDHADVSSDCDILHVSVETDDPGLVLQKGMKYGSLIGVAVLNKREEKEAVKTVPAEKAEDAPASPAKASAFVKTTVPESEWKEIGFIATAVGDGLSEVFRSLGVDAIVQGGQTMNPSTEDMLEAIESVPAKAIIILPNNKNIILAAQQAQKLCKSRKVEVLPTRNIPEGITAMSCFMPEDPLEDNLSMMREAFASVKSGEVTYAVRNTQIAGMEIHEGDFMGLGGPQGIYAVGKDKIQVLLDTIAAMVDEESGMITLYYGEDVKEDEGEALREKLTALYPDCDIDVICGGQPVYSFIASVE